MTGIPERPAVQKLRKAVDGLARIDVEPLDVDDVCRRYADDGYEVTSQLREFLENYGELTVTWTWRQWEVDLTTSVERTLEAPHATPRSLGIAAKRLGQPVALIGTTAETEDCVLLAENGDVLIFGDAGFQRVANGFENAVRAVVTGDWDKTFF